MNSTEREWRPIAALSYLARSYMYTGVESEELTQSYRMKLGMELNKRQRPRRPTRVSQTRGNKQKIKRA